MSWDKFEDGLEKGPTSAIFTIAKFATIAILVVLLVYGAVSVLVKPFVVASKVTNPDRMIYNYEYFYNQAEARNAIQRKIAAATTAVTNFTQTAGDRKDWTFEDKTEYSRLSSIVDGLKYQCADIVADYNAKAQQSTRNFVKSAATPYRLQECE